MKIYHSEIMSFKGDLQATLARLEDAIADNIHIHNEIAAFTEAPHNYVKNYAYGVMDAGSDLSHDHVCALVERLQNWAKWRYEDDDK